MAAFRAGQGSVIWSMLPFEPKRKLYPSYEGTHMARGSLFGLLQRINVYSLQHHTLTLALSTCQDGKLISYYPFAYMPY
jgi:hypothetical protein